MGEHERDYAEKRDFIRMRVDAEVSLLHEGQEIAGVCVDLSSSGMQVQAPRQFNRSQSRIYSEVGTGAQILQDLGVGKLRHLGPPLKYAGLTGYDLEVVESIPFTE